MLTFFAPIIEIKNTKEKSTFHQKMDITTKNFIICSTCSWFKCEIFQKFLEETGGIRGGWDEYDHGTFLKFRNRYKVLRAFIEWLILIYIYIH